MSEAHRIFWELNDKQQLFEFVKWICSEYPIPFKLYVEQFVKQYKRSNSGSAGSKDRTPRTAFEKVSTPETHT